MTMPASADWHVKGSTAGEPNVARLVGEVGGQRRPVVKLGGYEESIRIPPRWRESWTGGPTGQGAKALVGSVSPRAAIKAAPLTRWRAASRRETSRKFLGKVQPHGHPHEARALRKDAICGSRVAFRRSGRHYLSGNQRRAF